MGAPLGPIKKELISQAGMPRALAVSRPWRLQVDALVITPTTIILAEAKVYKVKQAVGDLMVYSRIFKDTPEFAEYRDWPLKLVMVIPWTTEYVRYVSEVCNVQIETFAPPWVVDYIEDHHKYWTAEYKRERQAKKELQEALGVS